MELEQSFTQSIPLTAATDHGSDYRGRMKMLPDGGLHAHRRMTQRKYFSGRDVGATCVINDIVVSTAQRYVTAMVSDGDVTE